MQKKIRRQENGALRMIEKQEKKYIYLHLTRLLTQILLNVDSIETNRCER
jgi:hypothetical protein